MATIKAMKGMISLLILLMLFIAGLALGAVIDRQICRDASKWEHLLAVLGNGAAYLWIFLVNGVCLQSFLFAVCASALIVLSLVDLRTFEIPPACNVVITIAGVINMLMDLRNWYMYVIGMALVSGIFLVIYFFSGGRSIGGGDIKLMAAAGLLLGWQRVLLSLFVGSVAGSVIHITLMGVKGKERVLAFGPYLAMGIFIAMLYGEKIIQWYVHTFLIL